MNDQVDKENYNKENHNKEDDNKEDKKDKKKNNDKGTLLCICIVFILTICIFLFHDSYFKSIPGYIGLIFGYFIIPVCLMYAFSHTPLAIFNDHPNGVYSLIDTYKI
jgi:xanthine/uracil permease